MSSLLPIFPGQRELWARPRPEPVSLELPGWRVRICEPNEPFPNARSWIFERDGGLVVVARTWDQPRSPGHPMVAASERPIVVDGRDTRLITTSMFEGTPRRVLTFWLRGHGHDVHYVVRVMLEGCDDALPEVLRRLRVHW